MTVGISTALGNYPQFNCLHCGRLSEGAHNRIQGTAIMSQNSSNFEATDPQVQPARRLSGETPEQAHQVGTKVFHPHQLQIRSPQEFAMVTTNSKIGPFTIGTLRYSVPVIISTKPHESFYQVNTVLKGSLRTTAGGQRRTLTPIRAAIYRPDVNTTISGWDQPCSMLGIKIDRNEFERIAASYLGLNAVSLIDFSVDLHIETGPGRVWMDSVRRLIGLAQQPWSQPLVTKLLVEECIIKMLQAGEHSLHHLLEDSPSIPPTALQRALNLIESVPEEALTLESIAYVAGVSGRALQIAFRKEMDVTPMQWLKAVRLDRVAHALRQSSAYGPTVADVARQFGFAHLGRFSAAYASRFGELPSETGLR